MCVCVCVCACVRACVRVRYYDIFIAMFDTIRLNLLFWSHTIGATVNRAYLNGSGATVIASGVNNPSNKKSYIQTK